MFSAERSEYSAAQLLFMCCGGTMKRKSRSRLASLTLLDIAAGIAVSAVAIPVLAAEVPAYNWTGFYLGAHAGYRWADADFAAVFMMCPPPRGTITVPGRRENYNLN